MAAVTQVRVQDVELKCISAELEISDGETWAAPLSRVLFAQMAWIENPASASAGTASFSISGNTLTFTANGVTDKDVHVTVWGLL